MKYDTWCWRSRLPPQASAARSVSPPVPHKAEPAQVLLHLLDYIAVDYPEFVKDGKILDQAEYDEQVEFAARARSVYGLFRLVGQGVAALQEAGFVSISSLDIPSAPALGIHRTVESIAAQIALLVLILVVFSRTHRSVTQTA